MKPLLAQDSKRLVVLDEKVKQKSLWELLLFIVCFACMGGLTVWGLFKAEAVQAIGERIDSYTQTHPNLVPSVCAGFVISVIGMYGIGWLFKKLKG